MDEFSAQYTIFCNVRSVSAFIPIEISTNRKTIAYRLIKVEVFRFCLKLFFLREFINDKLSYILTYTINKVVICLTRTVQ